MMVDFALEAERNEGMTAGRIDLPGLSAPIPADHDDDHGGIARRLAARPRRGTGRSCGGHSAFRIVGGLMLSQFLTLYTTPVIYLAFARLERLLRRNRPSKFAAGHGDETGQPSQTATNRSRVMNFSETFIRRPVATVLLTVSIILLGAIAYFRLPIASLPNFERPTIAYEPACREEARHDRVVRDDATGATARADFRPERDASTSIYGRLAL